MSSELDSQIIADIEKSGRLSEMKVYRTLKLTGWRNVTCSKYYIDKDENKGREVDINAYNNNTLFQEELGLSVGFHLYLEVKKSLNNPWVVFSTEPSPFEEAVGRGRMSNEIGLTQIEYNDKWKVCEEYDRLIIGDRIGRSYYAAFSNHRNDDESIYKAFSSAVKACEYTKEGEKTFTFEEKKRLIIYQPVVVLDGKLFEATIDANNAVNLRQVSFSCLSFSYISPNYKVGHKHVYLTTIDGLSEFSKNRLDMLQKLEETLSKLIRGGKSN